MSTSGDYVTTISWNRIGRRVSVLIFLMLLGSDSDATSPIKNWYKLDAPRSGDWISGTPYFVWYQFGNQESKGLRIGDRVRLHCVLLQGDEDSAPCDSFDLTTTLGTEELPLALNWALLRNKSGIDWRGAIEASKAVLDERFTACSPETTSYLAFRLIVAEWDTTGRSQITDAQRTLQQGILELRGQSGNRAAETLKPLVASMGESPFFRCLYAEALSDAGLCKEYARQSAILAKLGFGAAGFSITKYEEHCSHWQPEPYVLH
jgi:hypothetical protein